MMNVSVFFEQFEMAKRKRQKGNGKSERSTLECS